MKKLRDSDIEEMFSRSEAAEAKKLAQLAEASRERRRKAKRSRSTKAKLVESKRRRSETKKMRGKVA